MSTWPRRSGDAGDPDNRELALACGAALLNLRLAIRALDILPEVRLLPSVGQPDLLFVLRLGYEPR